VKAFILSISLAVPFTSLLVSGNTMAMSIRERMGEVARMRALGFVPHLLLLLFFGETVSLTGGAGSLQRWRPAGLVFALVHSQTAGGFPVLLKILATRLAVSLPVAALVRIVSAAVPSCRASRINIVQGLLHAG
jgi:putative ABC transport system permease protein